MWTKSHISHPRNPESRRNPKSAMAAARPTVAMLPGSKYRNGVVGSPRISRATFDAACAPICLATCATPGSGVPV